MSNTSTKVKLTQAEKTEIFEKSHVFNGIQECSDNYGVYGVTNDGKIISEDNKEGNIASEKKLPEDKYRKIYTCWDFNLAKQRKLAFDVAGKNTKALVHPLTDQWGEKDENDKRTPVLFLVLATNGGICFSIEGEKNNYVSGLSKTCYFNSLQCNHMQNLREGNLNAPASLQMEDGLLFDSNLYGLKNSGTLMFADGCFVSEDKEYILLINPSIVDGNNTCQVARKVCLEADIMEKLKNIYLKTTVLINSNYTKEEKRSIIQAHNLSTAVSTKCFFHDSELYYKIKNVLTMEQRNKIELRINEYNLEPKKMYMDIGTLLLYLELVNCYTYACYGNDNGKHPTLTKTEASNKVVNDLERTLLNNYVDKVPEILRISEYMLDAVTKFLATPSLLHDLEATSGVVLCRKNRGPKKGKKVEDTEDTEYSNFYSCDSSKTRLKTYKARKEDKSKGIKIDEGVYAGEYSQTIYMQDKSKPTLLFGTEFKYNTVLNEGKNEECVKVLLTIMRACYTIETQYSGDVTGKMVCVVGDIFSFLDTFINDLLTEYFKECDKHKRKYTEDSKSECARYAKDQELIAHLYAYVQKKVREYLKNK